ncbi:MAG: type VI secretion system baseplate subunit TssK [Pseudomonadota bacterium]
MWSEGLAVGPQQFQQQDLYHERRLQRMASAHNEHFWGVQSLAWSKQDLENNVLRTTALSLIFQDGEIYEAPHSDVLPVDIDLGALPMSEQVVTFYAGLPVIKHHGGNLAPRFEYRKDARYTSADGETPDLFSDASAVELVYLKKTVCLLSEFDSRDAYVSFPVVRLRRLPTSGFEIDPNFIPPAVTIRAAAGLLGRLQVLMGKMASKIDTLYGMHRETNNTTFEVHSGDISSFWMLNTLSTASASLVNCVRTGKQHPEVLYEKLMALAGGLMTFSNKYAIKDLPKYLHEDPGPAFLALDAIVQDLVDIVISSRFFPMPLKMDEKRTSHFSTRLDPSKVDAKTELYLAINADMAALELVASVPGRFKVASPDHIENIISSSLSGVPLMHMAQVPSAIPVRPNTYYFSIENRGPLYESILKTMAIVVYAPGAIKSLKLELIAVAP